MLQRRVLGQDEAIQHVAYAVRWGSIGDYLFRIRLDGELMDGHGRKIDFRQSIVVVTTNIANDSVTGYAGELDRHLAASVRKNSTVGAIFSLSFQFAGSVFGPSSAISESQLLGLSLPREDVIIQAEVLESHMAIEVSLEERVVALEVAVRDLQQADSVQRIPGSNWLEKVIGIMKDQPAFDEVLAYGKAIREADRSAEDETP